MAQITYRPIPAFLPTWIEGAENKAYKAYPDIGGVWTIGIGHTGPEVRSGSVATDILIDVYLREDLQIAVHKLYKVLSPAAILRLSENQWGAIISFVFNTGAGAGWEIWKAIEAGRLSDVPAELARFTKYRDKKTGQLVVANGLVNRRAAETAMWNTPDPVDLRDLQNVPPPAVAVMANIEPADIISSAATRNLETPPTVQFAKHAAAQTWAGIGTVVAVAPPAIKNVADTLSTWSTGHGWVDQAHTMIMGVGAAFAVAAVLYGWLNRKGAHNG